jgi:hypothetical protein
LINKNVKNNEQAIEEVKEKIESKSIRAEREEKEEFNKHRTVRFAEANRMGEIPNLFHKKSKIFHPRFKQHKQARRQQVVYWMV